MLVRLPVAGRAPVGIRETGDMLKRRGEFHAGLRTLRKGSHMKLIGMLDSPYVRRVAVSLQLLGLRFEHEALSVFRTYEQFRQINPVVKAPTLVCDDGDILLDSTLILDYAQALAQPRSLMPSDLPALRHDLKLIGLALAANEKAVQMIYEREQRPPEKLHQPWLDRVSSQLLAAWQALEEEVTRAPLPETSEAMSQAGVTVAVAWEFVQQLFPQAVPAQDFPVLAAWARKVEGLPEFRAAPHGVGTVQAA